jgi:hypothetical protein
MTARTWTLLKLLIYLECGACITISSSFLWY